LSINAIATFVLFNTGFILEPLTNITNMNYIHDDDDDDDDDDMKVMLMINVLIMTFVKACAILLKNCFQNINDASEVLKIYGFYSAWLEFVQLPA
jgi:uncharacterized protein YgfB (UPF0149 family)